MWQGMDSTIKFLIIGSVVSAGTSALWFIWRRFEHSLHSCIFQRVAKRFELSSHEFVNVNNMPAITRLLHLLDLRTHTFLWQHDANVDGDDAIMTGYIRLPTHTWFLWVLSLLGISHYIWISHDATTIHAVGPNEFIRGLLRLSSRGANRQWQQVEVDRLREVLLARAPRNEAESRCVQCERGAALALLCAAFALMTGPAHQWLLSTGLGLSIVIAFCCWHRHWLRSLCAGMTWAPALMQCTRSCCRCLRPPPEPADMLEQSLLEVAGMEEEQEPQSTHPRPSEQEPQSELEQDEEMSDDSEAEAEVEHDEVKSDELEDAGTYYNVAVARDSWYEIPCRRPLPTSSEQSAFQMLGGVGGRGSTRLVCAMPFREDMLNYVAGRVRTDLVLYLCMHNPMIDCPFIEMRELLKKAKRTIALVVILPPLEHFDEALTSPVPGRLHGLKETKFIATYSDWDAWVIEMTSGIFEHIALVFPCFSMKSCAASKAWQSARLAAPAIVVGS